jgi:hypothetical protein
VSDACDEDASASAVLMCDFQICTGRTVPRILINRSLAGRSRAGWLVHMFTSRTFRSDLPHVAVHHILMSYISRSGRIAIHMHFCTTTAAPSRDGSRIRSDGSVVRVEFS